MVYNDDLEKAHRNVVKFWKKTLEEYYGWELISVESSGSEVSDELDFAGIDWFAKDLNRGGLFGLAVRIQQIGYKTFTERVLRTSGAMTTMEKMLDVLGGLERSVFHFYPAKTIQVYIEKWDEGPALWAYVVESIPYWKYIKEGLQEEGKTYKIVRREDKLTRSKFLNGEMPDLYFIMTKADKEGNLFMIIRVEDLERRGVKVEFIEGEMVKETESKRRIAELEKQIADMKANPSISVRNG